MLSRTRASFQPSAKPPASVESGESPETPRQLNFISTSSPGPLWSWRETRLTNYIFHINETNLYKCVVFCYKTETQSKTLFSQALSTCRKMLNTNDDEQKSKTCLPTWLLRTSKETSHLRILTKLFNLRTCGEAQSNDLLRKWNRNQRHVHLRDYYIQRNTRSNNSHPVINFRRLLSRSF